MASSSLLNVFFFIASTAFLLADSAPFISNDVFDGQGSVGRNLLQTKQGCSVNFEFLNYTIITSQCKGPQYLAKLCCKAFKEFACPHAAEINDVSTECANTMFSYINLYGKYPPGLFNSECKEGPNGLDCSAIIAAIAPDTAKNAGSIVKWNLSPFIVAGACLLLMLF